MTIIDWIVIIWLVLEFFIGVKTGLVYRVGNLLGLFGSVYFAGQYYTTLAPWLGGGVGAQVSAFAIIVSIGFFLSGIVMVFVNKIFDIATIIPFLSSANRLLGGIFSVIVHILFLSTIFYFASKFDINPVLTQTLQESPVSQILIVIGGVMAFVLPEAIRSLDNVTR